MLKATLSLIVKYIKQYSLVYIFEQQEDIRTETELLVKRLSKIQ